MGDELRGTGMDMLRQFPMVVLTLGVGWYFLRYISKQHARTSSEERRDPAAHRKISTGI